MKRATWRSPSKAAIEIVPNEGMTRSTAPELRTW
jgi:hypothetical protein